MNGLFYLYFSFPINILILELYSILFFYSKLSHSIFILFYFTLFFWVYLNLLCILMCALFTSSVLPNLFFQITGNNINLYWIAGYLKGISGSVWVASFICIFLFPLIYLFLHYILFYFYFIFILFLFYFYFVLTFINNFLRYVSSLIRNYSSFLLHFPAYFLSPLYLKPSSQCFTI